MKLLAICAAILLVGCRTERDWKMVAASTRIEYGETRGGMDPHVGNKDYDSDSYYLGVSIQPFAFLEPPREVIVQTPAPCPPK